MVIFENNQLCPPFYAKEREVWKISRRTSEGMIACTRCGHWHTDAEDSIGKRLSCTEVKGYWAGIRRDHMDAYGHVAQLMKDDSGNWFCFKCKRPILKVGE